MDSKDLLQEALFNTEDYLEDTIKYLKLCIELQEEARKVVLNSQAKMIDLHNELKLESLKVNIREQLKKVYTKLLEDESQIGELKKNLKELEEMKNEIL